MDYLTLKQRQSWDLESKIIHSKNVIKEFYEHFNGKVYVSFSGGKDSTVLLHLVRSIYPEVVGVFLNTRVEYPEIIRFVHSTSNIVTVYPKFTFKQVIDKYGYPAVSKEQSQFISEAKTTKSDYLRSKRLGTNPIFKRVGAVSKKYIYLINAPFKISDKCCKYLKKEPMIKYEKETKLNPIMGNKAIDSWRRRTSYIRNNGCIAWNQKRPDCKPLSFWTDKDIWDYIHQFNISYSDIYDKGYNSTGCVLCLFGCHLQKEPNRIQLLKQTHPKLWNYAMKYLNYKEICDFIKVKYE